MGKVEMTPEVAKQLREPFAPELVGKLPRIWCRSCRDAAKQGRACDEHRRSRCRQCNNNITDAHLHLDYVGHAEVTDRFLQVDPEWEWAPMAFGPDGLPAIDKYGGLWIKLTIAGKTRIGYGHADGKEGPDAIKESIGDALRNAGMRFGVGLDLWGAKFKEVAEQPDERTTAEPSVRARSLFQLITEASSKGELKALWESTNEAGADGEITVREAKQLKAHITKRKDEVPDTAQAAAEVAQNVGPAEKQHKRMHALWRELDMGGDEHREERLTRTALVIGRDITTSKQLTPDEADRLIEALDRQVKERKGELAGASA